MFFCVSGGSVPRSAKVGKAVLVWLQVVFVSVCPDLFLSSDDFRCVVCRVFCLDGCFLGVLAVRRVMSVWFQNPGKQLESHRLAARDQ